MAFDPPVVVLPSARHSRLYRLDGILRHGIASLCGLGESRQRRPRVVYTFLRELACLHGLADPRHPATLESVFDKDEHLAIDAVEQLQDSAYL